MKKYQITMALIGAVLLLGLSSMTGADQWVTQH